MSEKMKWLEKYAPLGIGVEKQVTAYIIGVIVATLHSMLFLVRYLEARSELYATNINGMVLIEGAVIYDFGALTDTVFWTFYIVEIVTMLCSVFFYFYHYDGSKMMYLMKRLPDKKELYRRVFTLPIAGTVILVVWMGILRMLYFTIYVICTPSQCLPLPI